MKPILVPVEQRTVTCSVLDVALLVAGRCGSHVEGLALGPNIPDANCLQCPSYLEHSEREGPAGYGGTVTAAV
jgi:hypothetical protein